MSTSNIRGLGIIQDGFTRRWKSTGEVENVRWLEALGSTLAEAMEALQAQARLLAKNRQQERIRARHGQRVRSTYGHHLGHGHSHPLRCRSSPR